MRCFVTGSTGFVGRALTQFLVKQGHRIIQLSHDIDDVDNFMAGYGKLSNALFGDVRDFKRMREILYDYKPDAIIHLAAQAIVSQAAINPISTYETNVSGTINLLEAWKEACPKAYFLYFSTDKVYGNGLNKKETDPIQVTYDPYAASKAAADIIAQSYGATVTRSCNIYGPGDKHPSRLIPEAIQTCIAGQKPKLRMPNARREWIYVEDVCRILGWVLEKKKRGIWNLGSGQVLAVGKVINEILTHFPTISGYELSGIQLEELDRQSLNTEKLCAEMDCLAFTTLQAGIKSTVESWKRPLLSSLAA